MNKNLMPKIIAVIYGDGVGPEMMEPALRILGVICGKYGHRMEIQPVLAAGRAIDLCGDPFPEESVEVCRKADAVLFGNVGLKRYQHLPEDKRPESVLLKLRKALHVTTNIRPVRLYKSLNGFSPVKESIIKNGMDIAFVRDIAGGILNSNKVRGQGAHGQEAYEYEYYNEEIVKRTAEIAFELAGKRKKQVLSLDKANVLESSRLWRQTVETVKQSYPETGLSHCYVDTAAMWLLRNPWKYDVVLSSNMFGDIIADEGTEISGTPFLYGSAEISAEGRGIYTPNQLHWSDESTVGRQIVNPIGMIEAVTLMLRFSFHMEQEADEIEKAIERVVSCGYATPDIQAKGSIAVGTDEMGELISKELEREA